MNTGTPSSIQVEPLLTVSIVSMNNEKCLVPCLTTLIRHTGELSKEILVVAYLFEPETVEDLRRRFPDVTFICSDKPRGFGENHNLALMRARGKYCLVLNDDTYVDDGSIGLLVNALEETPSAAVVSPLILNTDGSIQLNGRPPLTFISWMFLETKLPFVLNATKRYTSGSGRYRTYGFTGACFLIRRSILKNAGYFDEQYFFTPEDLALSRKINVMGANCLVDTRAHIYHINSSTSSTMFSSILPVCKQGVYIYFRDFYGPVVEAIVRGLGALFASFKWLYWELSGSGERKIVMREAYRNVLRYVFVSISPKDLFLHLQGDEWVRSQFPAAINPQHRPGDII